MNLTLGLGDAIAFGVAEYNLGRNFAILEIAETSQPGKEAWA